METQHDQEFGLMTAQGDGDWELERRVLLNSQPVAITIELYEEMEPQQRQAIRYALALGPDALENAAPAVVQNYEVHRWMLGDEQAPPLEQPVDVWQQVQIDCIFVPCHYDAQHAYFLIRGECAWSWDGLDVRFRDGVAIEADQQCETGGARDDSPEELAMLRQLIADASPKRN